MEYVIEHGQHEYMFVCWIPLALYPVLGDGHFQKTLGQQRVKDRSRSEQARRLELEVIVCADYSYDRIRPAECVAVELQDLEGVDFIAG